MAEINSKLLGKLLKNDFEFKKAYELHESCDEKVRELIRKPHLMPEEEVEMNRLKKVKLAQKDRMEEIVARYRL